MDKDEIFKIDMISNIGLLNLDFYICNINNLDNGKNFKELGLVIYSKDTTTNPDDKLEIHNCDDFGIDKIEELIKYLQKVKRYIKKYNKNETN